MQNHCESRIQELAFRPVRPTKLEAFSIEALLRAGVSEKNARIAAEVLVTTDTWGIHTHGTNQLSNYVKKIRAGGIAPQAEPNVIAEGPAWAIIDGQSTIAMATSCMAMDIAMAKASSLGVGFAGVKNSNHFGAAGYYANMAAKRNMIGLAMSNGNPNMTVPGGRGSIIGNNPFAYAVPCEGGRSVFMDIATSTVAFSKVSSAKFLGKAIPNTWIVDQDGIPTTDLSQFPVGYSLQPMGAHKGYGLALMIEILSAVLTGAQIIDEIDSWILNLADPTRMGHAFLAIDINQIFPIGQFRERMNKLNHGMQQAPKAKGQERIFLPGEIEWEHREKALKHGMLLPQDVLASLSNLADDEKLQFEEIFEKSTVAGAAPIMP